MSDELVVHEVEHTESKAPETEPLVVDEFKLHDPKPEEVKIDVPEVEKIEPPPVRKVLRPWYEMLAK